MSDNVLNKSFSDFDPAGYHPQTPLVTVNEDHVLPFYFLKKNTCAHKQSKQAICTYFLSVRLLNACDKNDHLNVVRAAGFS